MNNQEWARDIKHFEWEELDGKTLQIRAGKHEGVMIVVGYDQETKDTFVLHEEFSTVPTIKPGDKVRHDDWGDGAVYALDQDDSAIAIVDFDDEGLMSIHCDELEVVE